MSLEPPEADPDEPEICEFCGGYIEDDDQDCPALYDGQCDADPFGDGGRP